MPRGPLNPQALNRFSYALNNPLRYTDPTGHCPFCIFLVTGLIGAGAGAIGSVISQAVQGRGIDLGNVAIAAGVGFVAGALAPVVGTTAGAIALGGDAAAAQYVLTQASNNEPVTAGGLAVNTFAGMISGGIVGPAPKAFGPFDPTSEWFDAASRQAAQAVNSDVERESMLKASTGVGNLLRNVLGGIFSNADWAKAGNR